MPGSGPSRESGEADPKTRIAATLRSRSLHWGRGGSEVPDKPCISFLRGDSQDALDLLQRRGHAVFHVVHERFDGCEPDVSIRRAALSRCRSKRRISFWRFLKVFIRPR
jgi:hypothetical protein